MLSYLDFTSTIKDKLWENEKEDNEVSEGFTQVDKKRQGKFYYE